MNSTLSSQSSKSTTSESNEEGVFQAELSGSGRRNTRSPLARGVLLLLFAAGVAVPTIVYCLPSEQAKWQIAAAQAKWLDDDLAGAIQILDAAARQFPGTAAIYEQRIQFYIEAKEFEKALADVERLAAISSEPTTPLGLKSQVLHHLGRHDEAITVCKEMLRLAEEEWIGNTSTTRNSLAYAQALGNTQLDQALQHINEAIRLAGDNLAMLDTRSFVEYRLGDLESARADIERAVDGWEQFVVSRETQRLASVRSYASELERAANQQTLAVLLYHRSLVYDRLKMRDEARADRQRVRAMGYDPNEKLF